MAHPRRRGHPHAHPRPRRGALPAVAALLLLFLAVSLLSIAISAPRLADRHPGGLGASSRRSLRHPQRSGWTARDGLWGSELASNFYGCSNASRKFPDSSITTQSDRYLIIVTSGGLNQQRTGIVDAVVAARILNATLVVPKLDQTSFWKDSSITVRQEKDGGCGSWTPGAVRGGPHQGRGWRHTKRKDMMLKEKCVHVVMAF